MSTQFNSINTNSIIILWFYSKKYFARLSKFKNGGSETSSPPKDVGVNKVQFMPLSV